jgi:hypothetical protein
MHIRGGKNEQTQPITPFDMNKKGWTNSLNTRIDSHNVAIVIEIKEGRIALTLYLIAMISSWP